MKRSLLVISLTSMALCAQTNLPSSSKQAVKQHDSYVETVNQQAAEEIEMAQEKLVGILRKQLKTQMKNGNSDYVVAIQKKIDALTGKSLNPPYKVENIKIDKALKLVDGAKPWSNRDYVFLNLPKKLLGMKYYQYEARSGKGVVLNIVKNCTVKIIVGGYKNDLPALDKWKKEGWKQQRRTEIQYTDHNRNELFVLSKDAKKGQTLQIHDYSEYAGIIVLTD